MAAEAAAAMAQERAELVCRLVATAAARRSSDCDLFEALRTNDVTSDELHALGRLVPELVASPAYENGMSLLRSFERLALAPATAFSIGHVEALVKAARGAATPAKSRPRPR